MLRLARHVGEEDSETEIHLNSSDALLSTSLSPFLAILDNAKEGRKRKPQIKYIEQHPFKVHQEKFVIYPWCVTS